jgi:hypothetical protein
VEHLVAELATVIYSARAMTRKVLCLAWILGSFSMGCGTEKSVSLNAAVGNASLAVAEQTLGTQLTGGFELYLELGPEASKSVSVELENFSIVHTGDNATVVSPLQAVPQNATFPVSVGVGERKTIPFVLDDTKLLPAADKAAICAEPVQIVGTVKSSGETEPLSSPSLTVGGC